MDSPRAIRGPGRFDVVVLVTSAGGLSALSSVLSVLGAELPVAVVVQQHLGRQDSVLAEILTSRTRLCVEWADDRSLLDPGRVVVARPRRRLEVRAGGSVSSLPNEDGARSFPHDALLTSLARVCGVRGVAVVLTGMGRDASTGAAAARAAGAVVLAQTPSSAEHPGMPSAAVEAGAVHRVLPLA